MSRVREGRNPSRPPKDWTVVGRGKGEEGRAAWKRERTFADLELRGVLLLLAGHPAAALALPTGAKSLAGVDEVGNLELRLESTAAGKTRGVEEGRMAAAEQEGYALGRISVGSDPELLEWGGPRTTRCGLNWASE